MKKNRSTLKDYFKKGVIPTESNFADLIDSMLNQEDDNISKLPNDPLKIIATGVDEALLNFYRIEKNEEKLSWQVKQNPDSKSGLSVSDTAASRLFIENGSGNVGLGTTSPKAKLQVVGGAIMPEAGSGETSGLLFPPDPGGGSGDRAWMRYYARSGEQMTLEIGVSNDANDHIALMPTGGVGIGSTAPIAKLDILQEARSTFNGQPHPTAVKGLYVTGSFNADSDGVEFRHSNGSQGIGFGFNTIYATGSNTNQDLGLKARGTGKVVVTGALQVNGDKQIVFTDTDTTNNLKLQLWSGYGLGINGSTLFYAANGNHSWRDANGTTERMLLTTAANGGLTVKGTGASSFAGDLGIGTTSIHNSQNWNRTVDIMGANHARLNVRSDTGGVVTSIFSNKDWDGPRGVIGTESNHPLSFAIGYAFRMTIDTDGNVGIGTTSPRSALDTRAGVLSGAPNDYVKAQFTLSGGGTVSWGGPGGRLKWSNRFIAISMEKSVSFSAGHMNINQPTSDIPAAQVYDGQARSATTDGVVLNNWEALYAVHTVGGDQSAVSYQITRYTHNHNAPSNWILVAVVNDDDDTIKLGTGTIVAKNSSSSYGSPIPRGVITMWSGATNDLPSGWALCNGNNGTPDLRNRFIVGAGSSYGVGNTGGADTVALTTDQMPSHNHNNQGGYNYDRLLTARPDGHYTSKDTDTTVGEPDLIHSASIQPAGGNKAHENRPPYYALAYIMKL